ncbi:MAG: alpha/beta hydrolase, partial [Dehalococcoidia bacterium]|nr:alpha/beta hydrolase [Dehalococcoidia bacterium]
GAGLSQGDFDMRGWTRDLGAAIDYLLGVKAVEPSHVFVMGFSGGAAAAICRAAQDSRIAGVVSCASPADFEDLIEGQKLDDCLARWRQIGIVRDPLFPRDMAEWATGFRDVAPVEHIARISPRPILILHGDADDVVPVSHAHRLSAAAREPKSLSIIPDGLHRLRVNEQAMSIALDWLHARSSG